MVMPAAAAADKGDRGLQLGQVMIGVHNDLLPAGDGAGRAAHTLVVVDLGAVVHHGDGALGTGLHAVAAANAAVTAQADGTRLLVLIGTGDEVGGIGRHHVDQVLYTGVGAGAAAVALFLVHLDIAIHNRQGPKGTGSHAGTGAYASIDALSVGKAALHRLLTGAVYLQSGLPGRATGTFDKRGFLPGGDELAACQSDNGGNVLLFARRT